MPVMVTFFFYFFSKYSCTVSVYVHPSKEKEYRAERHRQKYNTGDLKSKKKAGDSMAKATVTPPFYMYFSVSADKFHI